MARSLWSSKQCRPVVDCSLVLRFSFLASEWSIYEWQCGESSYPYDRVVQLESMFVEETLFVVAGIGTERCTYTQSDTPFTPVPWLIPVLCSYSARRARNFPPTARYRKIGTSTARITKGSKCDERYWINCARTRLRLSLNACSRVYWDRSRGSVQRRPVAVSHSKRLHSSLLCQTIICQIFLFCDIFGQISPLSGTARARCFVIMWLFGWSERWEESRLVKSSFRKCTRTSHRTARVNRAELDSNRAWIGGNRLVRDISSPSNKQKTSNTSPAMNAHSAKQTALRWTYCEFLKEVGMKLKV